MGNTVVPAVSRRASREAYHADLADPDVGAAGPEPGKGGAEPAGAGAGAKPPLPAPGGGGGDAAPRGRGRDKLKSLLVKNARLRKGGIMCCCSAAEIVLPLLFFALMCLPKLLVQSMDPGRNPFIRNVDAEPAVAGDLADIRWTDYPANYCKYAPAGGGGRVAWNNLQFNGAYRVGFVRPPAGGGAGGGAAAEVAALALEELACRKPDVEWALADLVDLGQVFRLSGLPDVPDAAEGRLEELEAAAGGAGGGSPGEVVERALFQVLQMQYMETVGPQSFLDVVAGCHTWAEIVQRFQAALASPDLDLSQGFATRANLGVLLAAFADLIGADAPGRVRVAPGACEPACRANATCFAAAVAPFVLDFASLEEARAYVKDHPAEVAAVVEIPDDVGTAAEVRYALHMNGTDVANVERRFVNWATEKNRGPAMWKGHYPTVNFQNALDAAVLRHRLAAAGEAGAPPPDVDLAARVASYPVPSYYQDNSGMVAANLFPMLMVVAFLPTVVIQLNVIVQEKQLRLREGMQIMGLSSALYWVGHFITVYLPLVLVSLVCTGVSTYCFTESDPSVLLVYFLVWLLMLCSFSSMMSTFFSRTTIANVIAAVIYFASFIPGAVAYLTNRGGGTFWMVATCFPASGMYLFGWTISYYESMQEGLQWSNVAANFSTQGGYVSTLGLMGVNLGLALWFACLTWYLDKVWPNNVGQTQPPWFPFLPSYWFPAKGRGAAPAEAAPAAAGAGNEYIETVQAGAARPSIEVKGLTKRFGQFTAVNGLDVDMYPGEVTALLGHNGAGKTTTMNMLVGMLDATAGEARINGLSINTSMAEIRRHMGFCPQFDILWPLLTVREHLTFFSIFKGVASAAIPGEVERLVRRLDLWAQADQRAGTLSGGQARRLSLGIAMVGNPDTIFLDEPTSGVDPAARRVVWDVIVDTKRLGKTIVLTTHFMDEADILGDRIAILSHGKLFAYGSSFFLKSKFCLGHFITLSLDKSGRNSAADLEQLPAQRDAGEVADLTRFLRQTVRGATLESFTGSEAVYMLPNADLARFGALLRGLDAQGDGLGVRSYGISCSTLEEVFINSRHAADAAELAASARSLPSARKSLDGARDEPSAAVEGAFATLAAAGGGAKPRATALGQFKFLLLKRLYSARGDKIVFVTQLIVPVVFWVMALGLLLIPPPFLQSQEALVFDPSYINAPAKPVPTSAVAGGEPLPAGYGRGWAPPVPTEALGPWGTAGEAFDRTEEALLYGRTSIVSSCGGAGGNDTCTALVWDGGPAAAGNASAGNASAVGFSHTVFVNQRAFHAAPVGVGLVNEAIARDLEGAGVSQLRMQYQAFPTTATESQSNIRLLAIPSALAMAIALACLSAAFSIFPTFEKSQNFKMLQYVNGVNEFGFWFATFVFDVLIFLVPCALFFAVLCAMPTREFYFYGNGLLGVAVILLLFGPAAISQTYLLSLPFKSEMSCFGALFAGYSTLVLLLFMVALVLELLIMNDVGEGTEAAWSVLQYVFPVLPQYTVIRALFAIVMNSFTHDLPVIGIANVFDIPFMKEYLLYLVALPAVQVPLIVLFDIAVPRLRRRTLYSKTARPEAPGDEDRDVRAERERVQGGEAGDLLEIRHLKKVYHRGACCGRRPVAAVKGLSVGLRGECFGLLGVNGAGKTTTFKMLTGEVMPSSGSITVNHQGRSVNALSRKEELKNLVGYCPQFGGLLPRMTVEEHLRFFMGVRGITRAAAADLVDAFLDMLKIRTYRRNPAGTLSGGNQRKLSVALALIGNPALVLLDEPSTGLDPDARRTLWDVIRMSCRDRTVILTSHSMEECEALCQALAIMVRGRFECFGSVQHLKSRFGKGYTCYVRCRPGGVDAVKAFLAERAPYAVPDSEHELVLKYSIAMDHIGHRRGLVAGLFELLGEYKAAPGTGLEEFSLSQTSLEEVFLRLAAEADDDVAAGGEP